MMEEKFPCDNLELILTLFGSRGGNQDFCKIMDSFFKEDLAHAKIKDKIDGFFNWEDWLRKHVASCERCNIEYAEFLNNENVLDLPTTDMDKEYLNLSEYQPACQHSNKNSCC